ncbi:hypothetical protein [Gracilibacillus massiliensis]|uniref:hypothetical protein n=1 Tax=Gracilibacillus massiliensis TaxID=1564956 RepID=UPI0011DCB979|nr:hypothetical protein [Gracilibacillus massiliensis]
MTHGDGSTVSFMIRNIHTLTEQEATDFQYQRKRFAKHARKKVMTTDKWLHHAYFQDHEPAVIDRLGQTEQLDLF